MTSPASAASSVLKSEPVLASAAATWLLTNVGLILAHFHLLGSVEWNGLSASLAPEVSAVILAGIGWATRRKVTSPATAAALQAELATVKAALAQAQASEPTVITLNGQAVTAVVTGNPAPADNPTPLDGLPAVSE